LEKMKVSVAIPYHGNRYQWASRTVHNIHHCSYVDEIVVCIEPGEGDSKRFLGGMGTYKKMKSFLNPSRLGAFFNKIEAVKKCSSEWVALIDSDNIITPEYFRAAIATWPLCEKVIYCPSLALPKFNFEHFVGADIGMKMAVELFGEKQFDCLLNDGNYLFHRDTWLKSLEAVGDNIIDAIWTNYHCMKNGMVLRPVMGMSYIHTVHPGSTYLTNAEESRKQNIEIKNMMRRFVDESRTGPVGVYAEPASQIPGSSNYSATGRSGVRLVHNEPPEDQSELLTD